jgi:hypothetical protein
MGRSQAEGEEFMTDRELMQQALDALEAMQSYAAAENKGLRICDEAIEALRARLAQPKPKPVAHYVIAGALFDFMGWLTSRKERIVLSSADNASPAVEVITEFAKMRGLSLDDAKVQDWNTAPPQREWQGLTDEEYEAMAENHVTNCYFDTLTYARAVETKLKEKNHG